MFGLTSSIPYHVHRGHHPNISMFVDPFHYHNDDGDDDDDFNAYVAASQRQKYLQQQQQQRQQYLRDLERARARQELFERQRQVELERQRQRQVELERERERQRMLYERYLLDQLERQQLQHVPWFHDHHEEPEEEADVLSVASLHQRQPPSKSKLKKRHRRRHVAYPAAPPSTPMSTVQQCHNTVTPEPLSPTASPASVASPSPSPSKPHHVPVATVAASKSAASTITTAIAAATTIAHAYRSYRACMHARQVAGQLRTLRGLASEVDELVRVSGEQRLFALPLDVDIVASASETASTISGSGSSSNSSEPSTLSSTTNTSLRLAYSPANRPFLAYEDALLRVMLAVDAIDTHRDEIVRSARRKLVKRVEGLLCEVDAYRGEALQSASASAHVESEPEMTTDDGGYSSWTSWESAADHDAMDVDEEDVESTIFGTLRLWDDSGEETGR